MKKYEHLPYFHVLLQTVFFDSIFSSDERNVIMSHMDQVDSILFSQGDLPEFLYIIVDGTVEFIQSDMKGNSTVLQRL